VAAHTPGHAAARAAQLKEQAYSTSYLGDLFYPLALEVYGALHPVLDRFLSVKV
jgi:hypothetical protein